MFGVLAFAVGASVGSFLNVVAMLVELATGLLFAVSYLRFDLGAEFALTCVALSLMVVVAVIDLEHGLILNRIMLPSAVVLLLLAPFWSELGVTRSFLGSESMLASLANSVASAAGAFLLFLAIALVFRGGMGGGDVKLAGVLGLLLGFPGILAALWLGIVIGGLVAVVLLALRIKGRKDEIPFGPFLALGAIAALLAGSDEIVDRYEDLVSAPLAEHSVVEARLLKVDYGVAVRHLLARLNVNGLDDAGPVCTEALAHLHRLQNTDLVAGDNLIANTYRHRDYDAWHG